MTLDLIQKLQTYPERIRNFTICAHIDHGKTTLTDSLLASNDLLNSQQAGQLRHLDYLPLEQYRCITLKASLVSLIHVSYRQPKPYAALFHLFDSPGHCDFASEVLQAFSLSDSAVLLVDVVESVSSQTQLIIKQLKQLKLKVVLGINKVDRLFTELRMSSEEAFGRILEVIAEVNYAFGKSRFSLDSNVFVASSLHGWGFDSYCAAQIVKLLCKYVEEVDIYYLYRQISLPNTVLTENGVKEGTGPSVMSMVFYIVLHAYQDDVKMVKKYIKKTKLSTTANDAELSMRFLKELFPLSTVVFDYILTNGPDRHNLYIQELEELKDIDSLLICTKALRAAEVDVEQKTTGHLTICRVYKSFRNDTLEISAPFFDQMGRQVSVLRVFQPFGKTLKLTTQCRFCSGCIVVLETDVKIKPGSILFYYFVSCAREAPDDVLGELTARSSDVEYRPRYIESGLLQMIKDKFDSARTSVLRFYKPLITVCLRVELLSQYNNLIVAVYSYCDCDSSCTCSISDLGELMLSVCGDVHLDLCVQNIREQVPSIEFYISDSSFKIWEVLDEKETTIPLKAYDRLDEKLFEVADQIFAFLNQENSDTYRSLTFIKNLPQLQDMDHFSRHYQRFLGDKFDSASHRAAGLEISVITALDCSNITCTRYTLVSRAFPTATAGEYVVLYEDAANNNRLCTTAVIPEAMKLTFVRAFQANMRQGPICLEQMQDVTVVVEMAEIEERTADLAHYPTLTPLIQSHYPSYYTPVSPTISACYASILDVIRASLEFSTLRIKEPHLKTLIQAPSEQSSLAMQLLQQFQTQDIAIIGCSKGHMNVQCLLPLRHALRFSKELRQSCSGRANVEFSEIVGVVLPEDPRKDLAGDLEEEIEWGQLGRGNNLAAQVILMIQERKGLIVEDIVKDGEKQRTSKKNR